MKKYNVTINGNVYEVEVEEVGSTATSASSVQSTVSQPVQATAPVQPTPVSTPKPTPAPASASQGEVVSAPMPGTVLNVTVSVGDVVKAGQTLLILEAMKMENEIVAPHDATIAAINTTKGSSVNTGDALITLS